MTNSHNHVVILAGGSGTRFWPLSRAVRPKQFLNVINGASLFEQTLERVQTLVPPENIWIVTNKNYSSWIRRQSGSFSVPAQNILWEPTGRNTAPAICWAAAKIKSCDPQAVMVVLPSDHLIGKPKKFLACLKKAIGATRQGYLVTLGIQPTRPETGYGYLQTVPLRDGSKSYSLVKKFTEKPERKVAERFFKNKAYLWNSGMFIWTADQILKEFQIHLPDVYERIGQQHAQAHINRVWASLPSVSIDYGILEKAEKVAAVAGVDIGWSDLGSWEALNEILSGDAQGNKCQGKVIAIDSQGSLIWSDKRVVGVAGLENFIVVDTPDALLICPSGESQKVKDLVLEMVRKYPKVT